MEWLSALGDLVIFISAVVLAIINILNFIGKPIKAIRKKQDTELNKKINARLDEILPEYFDKRDQETRAKYLSQRQAYLKDIQGEVLFEVSVPLHEINDLLSLQTDAIETLQKGTKDVLRQKILDIYHEYKHIRRFPIYVKEKLDELYKDYKAENGNSYIDKYYGRMKNWEVDYSEDNGMDEI